MYTTKELMASTNDGILNLIPVRTPRKERYFTRQKIVPIYATPPQRVP